MEEVNSRCLSFERILALSNKASLYNSFTYGCDYNLTSEYALDVWVEKKQEIEELNSNLEMSINDREKQIYFIFKDNIRSKMGVFQVIDEDGNKVRKSPHYMETAGGYDTTNEDFVGLEELSLDNQKDIYYTHQKELNLSSAEILFIDLTFAGFNYANDIDVLVFKEALQTDSTQYVKTFFNRLCKKLIVESERIGLR